jgi:hypothetical protein
MVLNRRRGSYKKVSDLIKTKKPLNEKRQTLLGGRMKSMRRHGEAAMRILFAKHNNVYKR